MIFVLNETEFVNNALKNGITTKNPKDTLYILSKYYYAELKLNQREVILKLNEYMQTFYKNFNPVRWDETIEYIARKTKGKQLHNIEHIPITINEIDTIKSIKSKVLQRLVFTLLCIAKYFNIVYETNNDWVNVEFKTIFNLAHLQKTKNEQALLMNDLKSLGLISYGKAVDNVNINVQFVDRDSNQEIAISITDFRELGYEYLNYLLPDEFRRCEKCDRLIRKIGKRIYCKEHQGYTPVETKTIKCIDCDQPFFVDARNMTKKRCDHCQSEYRKEWDRIRKQNK